MHLSRIINWPMAALLSAAILVPGCTNEDLTIPNYSNPTPEAVTADPLTNVQTRANGILNLARRNLGWNSDAGLFGRESFSYGTDSRSTTSFLDAPAVDPGGLAAGSWTGFYTTLRSISDFLGVIETLPSGVLTTQQASSL